MIKQPKRAALAFVVVCTILPGMALAQDRRDEMALLAPAAQLPKLSETSDVNLLTLESDFSVYMDRKIPEELRLKALRHLWKLLPPVEVADNSAI